MARPGAEPRRALDDIQAWIRTESGLPSLKRPKRLVVVDRIPTSAVGKILRRRLIEGDYEILADTEAVTS